MLQELKYVIESYRAATFLGAMGGIEAAIGNIEKAARLLGTASALLKISGEDLSPEDRTGYEGGMAVVQQHQDEERVQTAWRQGQAMAMEQAIAYALEENDGQ